MATEPDKTATADSKITLSVDTIFEAIADEQLLAEAKTRDLLVFKEEKEMVELLKTQDYKVFEAETLLETVINAYKDEVAYTEWDSLAELLKEQDYIAVRKDDVDKNPLLLTDTASLNDEYLHETITDLLLKYTSQQLADKLRELT